MKNFHHARFALQTRLWLTRFGWANGWAMLLFVLGAGAWLWAVPQLKTQSAATHIALKDAQKVLDGAAPAVTTAALRPAEQHLHAFYDALGESRYAEQQVKTLFAVAAKNGLTLNQAEYKFANDTNGRFHTYTISLPVKGQYAAIRPFCEQVLLAIPFAALDEINFKREAIGNPVVEAKLRFTLYLDDVGGVAGEMLTAASTEEAQP